MEIRKLGQVTLRRCCPHHSLTELEDMYDRCTSSPLKDDKGFPISGIVQLIEDVAYWRHAAARKRGSQ